MDECNDDARRAQKSVKVLGRLLRSMNDFLDARAEGACQKVLVSGDIHVEAEDESDCEGGKNARGKELDISREDISRLGGGPRGQEGVSGQHGGGRGKGSHQVSHE
jgi:hypothetical protein